MKTAQAMRNTTVTPLSFIEKDMEKRAAQGEYSLDLFYNSMDGTYYKNYDYSTEDLDQLEKLGYIIEVAHVEEIYSGFFKRKLVEVKVYHRISWK